MKSSARSVIITYTPYEENLHSTGVTRYFLLFKKTSHATYIGKQIMKAEMLVTKFATYQNPRYSVLVSLMYIYYPQSH